MQPACSTKRHQLEIRSMMKKVIISAPSYFVGYVSTLREHDGQPTYPIYFMHQSVVCPRGMGSAIPTVIDKNSLPVIAV